MTEVARFLDGRDLPMRPEIDRVRALVATAVPDLVEGVKWNAPSFSLPGADHCVTLKIHPPWTVQVIFHRGARVKPPRDVTVLDPASLARWVAPDRGVVTYKTMDEIEDSAPALSRLVQAWVAAMRAE